MTTGTKPYGSAMAKPPTVILGHQTSENYAMSRIGQIAQLLIGIGIGIGQQIARPFDRG